MNDEDDDVEFDRMAKTFEKMDVRIAKLEADNEKLRKAHNILWNEVEKVRAAIESTSRGASEAQQPNLSAMLYRYAVNLQAALKASRQALADTE